MLSPHTLYKLNHQILPIRTEEEEEEEEKEKKKKQREIWEGEENEGTTGCGGGGDQQRNDAAPGSAGEAQGLRPGGRFCPLGRALSRGTRPSRQGHGGHFILLWISYYLCFSIYLICSH